jgi:hypothetical protein
MPREGRPKVERVELICAGCGGKVLRRITEVTENSRVFCSRACIGLQAAGLRDGGGTKPRRGTMRACIRCGTEFYAMKSSTQRTCSRECSDAVRIKSRLTQVCETCGVSFEVLESVLKYNTGKYCSRACADLGRMKQPLDRTHNGKPARLNDDGYVLVWEPDNHNAHVFKGWVAEHRLIAEQMVGRPLTPKDEVHHINRIKADNRPENLEVLDGDTHRVITQRQRQSDVEMLARYVAKYGPLGPDD